MSITFIIVAWLFAFVFGYMNGSWRGLQKREAWVACSLLLICLALSVVMAINPQPPNMTEWVDQALSPLKPLLEPVK